MSSIIEAVGDRTIGSVEEVSTGGIIVLLDPDAPQSTALNTGTPTGFPRINGYLLLPNESGATVGIITRVEVVPLPYPKRRGMQDFGLIDLPFPARRISLTPLCTLMVKPGAIGEDMAYEVRRGVDVFPSVGDPVLLPTRAQLSAIVEGESVGAERRILIGTCPTAASLPVHVDPDKLFGRHLAVLGNTGSGKSCSVAGLIRWSLDAASSARVQAGLDAIPNARFIILDPNGEYAAAFSGFSTRLFQVTPQAGATALKVPAWLWNGDEWAAFTGAAPGVQRPILFDALRRLRSGAGMPNVFQTKVRLRVKNYHVRLRLIMETAGYMGFPKREDCANVLINTRDVFHELAEDRECTDGSLRSMLNAIADNANTAERSAQSYVDREGSQRHNDIDDRALDAVIESLQQVAGVLGISADEIPISEDTPLHFPVSELPELVKGLAIDSTGRDLAQFVDSLNLRIRGLFAGGSLSSVLNPSDATSTTLDQWLTDQIGSDQGANGPISIIDLSLVPSEVIHIVVAVIARMVFEAIQRYRRAHVSVLPTVLVLEEAHVFVHHDLTSDGAPPAGKICCKTFERIAREGRKFGLGLVLASQRPSEMSATVLSQCNTFLLHRIVNDRDQDLVRKLVPDALGDLLRELPSLPSRRAILLGWGAPTPVLVEVRELPIEYRPHSPDPDYWNVWTGKQPRPIDWSDIANSWVDTGMVHDDEHTNGIEASQHDSLD